jgi:hypothetical protein
LDVHSSGEPVLRGSLHFAADRLNGKENLDQVIVLNHFDIASVDTEELVCGLVGKSLQLFHNIVQVA